MASPYCLFILHDPSIKLICTTVNLKNHNPNYHKTITKCKKRTLYFLRWVDPIRSKLSTQGLTLYPFSIEVVVLEVDLLKTIIIPETVCPIDFFVIYSKHQKPLKYPWDHYVQIMFLHVEH